MGDRVIPLHGDTNSEPFNMLYLDGTYHRRPKLDLTGARTRLAAAQNLSGICPVSA